LVFAAAGHIVDPPGARRIVVAVELQSRHVVFRAPPSRDGEALARLDVLDLVAVGADRIQPPAARWLAVAVELQSRHVVVSAHAPGDDDIVKAIAVDISSARHAIAEIVGRLGGLLPYCPCLPALQANADVIYFAKVTPVVPRKAKSEQRT
jgi:hypothetical protein